MSWAGLLGGTACAGWALALSLVLSWRRRRSLMADAEHELRGAAAAIGLAAERVSRTGATIVFSSLVRMQLDRMAAGLEDLAAARAPRRAARTGAVGGGEMDAGRLAQVLGNLIANATEHGVGSVDVSTSRLAGAVRIEIRNRNRPPELDDASTARAAGRGRGLAIAERAARELGGRLRVESAGDETRAELELPAGDDGGAERTEAVTGAAVAVTGAEPMEAVAGAERTGAVTGAEAAVAAGPRPSRAA